MQGFMRTSPNANRTPVRCFSPTQSLNANRKIAREVSRSTIRKPGLANSIGEWEEILKRRFEVVFPHCVAPRRFKLKTLKSHIRGRKAYRKTLERDFVRISKEISRIDAGLSAFRSGSGRPPGKTRRRRPLSKEARQRISVAQKKRWAAAGKAAS
jgi:hypothetical protein